MTNAGKWLSFIALGASVLAVLSGPVAAGPAIKVINPTFNFGKTLQHVSVTHDFWIKSVGDQPLVITKVVPGCGCTKAPLRDSVLAPGDSTVLSITFSTRSYAGKITKKPYLLTNVSDERVPLTLQVEVMIDPEMAAPLKISPFEIKITPPDKQQHRRAAILIENRGERDLSLSMVSQPRGLFQASLPTVIKAGETAEATVVVEKKYAGQEFEKSFTFQISDPERTRYSIPVSCLLEVAGSAGQ
ncbi:MAG: DUF1573 domain-containing protein [Candidatus Zixiibacteriota bacterium]|nr:MAG: DUF1573 domain-containing protein [candidate division Zixibacteria bacterium]